MSDLGDAYTNLAFWLQIQGDAKRTILCEPHRTAEVQAAVEARGYSGIITVRPSPVCPEGQLLVIDDPAIEASGREAAQRVWRSLHP